MAPIAQLPRNTAKQSRGYPFEREGRKNIATLLFFYYFVSVSNVPLRAPVPLERGVGVIVIGTIFQLNQDKADTI